MLRFSQEVTAEIQASSAYDTEVLAEGQGATQHLMELAEGASDHIEVCCDAPLKEFEGNANDRDTTMFGTTSLMSFFELVQNVEINAVVKVVYRYKESRPGHIVVVGPNGFQLCTCLQLLRCGLPCRHTLAALVTKLGRGAEFSGESIHPRWRTSCHQWSIEKAGLCKFDGHERGEYRGGFTDDFDTGDITGSQDDLVHTSTVSVVRGRLLANMVDIATKAARKMAENFDGQSGSYEQSMELFRRLQRDVDSQVTGPVTFGPNCVAGIGNPPLANTRSRKESRHKDCTEGPARKKSRGSVAQGIAADDG